MGTDDFRTRTLQLLGKSYSLVPVALGEVYLGMPLDEFAPSKSKGCIGLTRSLIFQFIPAAQEKGWSVNARDPLSPPQRNVGRECGSPASYLSPFLTSEQDGASSVGRLALIW